MFVQMSTLAFFAGILGFLCSIGSDGHDFQGPVDSRGVALIAGCAVGVSMWLATVWICDLTSPLNGLLPDAYAQYGKRRPACDREQARVS